MSDIIFEEVQKGNLKIKLVEFGFNITTTNNIKTTNKTSKLNINRISENINSG